MPNVTDVGAPQRGLIINTDGGSRGNPGNAATGVVITTSGGEHLESFGRYMGVATNNQAEYTAVVDALEAALKYTPEHIIFRLDSELVVKQLNGLYKVKNLDLKPIFDDIKRRTSESEVRVTFTHVPRAQNALADAEVNKALDAHLAGL